MPVIYNRRTALQRYGIALLCVLGALLLSLALRSYLEQIPFLLFVAAALIAVWYGGARPALTVIALSVPLVSYFLLRPYNQISTDSLSMIWTSVYVSTTLLIVVIFDQQTRLNRLLYAQQEQFQVTLKSIGDAVIATDERGSITFMNPVAELLTGTSLAEAEGRPIQDLFMIFKDSQEMPDALPIERVLREGRVVGLTNHTLLVTKRGDTIPIDDTAAPIRDNRGSLIGTVLVFRDISERRSIERKAREFETKFRQMVDTAPVLLWATDANHQATFFNQGWLDFTGRALEEELSSGWQDRIYSDDRSSLNDALRAGALSTAPIQVEFRARRYDSTYRWILCTGTPRIASDGGFEGFTGSCVDIHERKRLEEGLRFLQSITAALSEAVTLKQVGDVMVEQALLALGGHLATVSLLDDTGHALEILSSSELPPTFARLFELAPLDLPAPITDAVRRNTPIWIESSADCYAHYPIMADKSLAVTGTEASVSVPLCVKGTVIGGIGISFPEPRTFTEDEKRLLLAIADQSALAIDRAKQYEAVQAAQIQAEHANALKVRFLGMISHELRTPLTPIKGFVTTLLADDVVYDANDQRHYLSVISEEADKLADLIDQLLDLSRLQTGTLGIRPKAESLRAILDSAAAQLATLSQEHPLDIELPENQPFIMADKRRVAQVITNLVGNAARYSPSGKPIHLRAQVDPTLMQIDVRDEGPGIPLDAQKYIFEAFRRVEGRTSPKGTGLGLAICKGLVEAHGGRIWISDSTERGTTISFTLPLLAEITPEKK